MKTRTWMLAVALMLGAQSLMAQDNKAPMEKMMATEAANQLMLNEATSAKFIPIYENYLKSMQEVRTKYADKACCGPRPDGRRDMRPEGPRPEPRKDGQRPEPRKDGQRHDDKKGPRPQPRKDMPKPEGQACPKDSAACCGPKVLTDAEVEKRVKDRIACMREEADVQEKYYKELRSILTPLQIVRVLDFGPKGK
jgi:hypothetical protein